MAKAEDTIITDPSTLTSCEITIQKKRAGIDHMRFSMHLFLPNEKDGLPKLLEEFSDNPSLLLNDKLAVSKVVLDKFIVPKFIFSYTFDVSRFISGLGLGMGELTEMIDDHDGNAARLDGVVMLHISRIL